MYDSGSLAGGAVAISRPFFQFVHNVRRRGKAPIGTLVGGLIGFANPPYSLSRDSELLCR